MPPIPNSEPDSPWQYLAGLVPEVKALTPEEQAVFAGRMHHALLEQQAESAVSTSVFALSDEGALRGMIGSLPFVSLPERQAHIAEWRLDPETEADENAHWAFRHQAVHGELLDENRLIPFKLIRMQEFTYLLLASLADEKISRQFSLAFGKAPSLHSERILSVEGMTWHGWAWFMHPDADAAVLAASQWRALWQEQNPTDSGGIGR